MTPLRRSPRARRSPWPVFALASALLFTPAGAPLFPGRPTSLFAAASRAKPPSPEALPFTDQHATRYFTRELGSNPVLLGNTAVFTGDGGGHREDSYEISVAGEGDSVVITFTGHGDYGMTLAREFFEAPFFERDETLRFYQLLSHGRTVHSLAMRRFTLGFQLVEHRDDFHLTMRFEPKP